MSEMKLKDIVRQGEEIRIKECNARMAEDLAILTTRERAEILEHERLYGTQATLDVLSDAAFDRRRILNMVNTPGSGFKLNSQGECEWEGN